MARTQLQAKRRPAAVKKLPRRTVPAISPSPSPLPTKTRRKKLFIILFYCNIKK